MRYVHGATAFHRVGHSSRSTRASAIRAFHQSAYLYYATHVAPGGSQHRITRRVRRRVKRMIARALLGTRCWLHLKEVRDRSSRAEG